MRSTVCIDELDFAGQQRLGGYPITAASMIAFSSLYLGGIAIITSVQIPSHMNHLIIT